MIHRNNFKKLLSLLLVVALAFAALTVLSSCDDEEEAGSVTFEGIVGEIQKKIIKVLEGEEELNQDAKDYLELVKQNLPDMAVGYTSTETMTIVSTATVEGGTAVGNVRSVTNSKWHGTDSYSFETRTETGTGKAAETTTEECWTIGNTMYMKFDYGNGMVAKTKLDISAHLGDVQSVLSASSEDQSAIDYLIPAVEDVYSTLKKETTDSEIIFTFDAQGVVDLVGGLLPQSRGIGSIVVTFGKDGKIRTVKVTITMSNAFEGMAATTNGEHVLEFSDLGVSQTILPPEDADEYEPILF